MNVRSTGQVLVFWLFWMLRTLAGNNITNIVIDFEFAAKAVNLVHDSCTAGKNQLRHYIFARKYWTRAKWKLLGIFAHVKLLVIFLTNMHERCQVPNILIKCFEDFY